MKKVDMHTFLLDTKRYELRQGSKEKSAPKCPYGNTYQWIGYDLQQKEYVRFTNSVFKKLIQQYDTQNK